MVLEMTGRISSAVRYAEDAARDLKIECRVRGVTIILLNNYVGYNVQLLNTRISFIWGDHKGDCTNPDLNLRFMSSYGTVLAGCTAPLLLNTRLPVILKDLADLRSLMP